MRHRYSLVLFDLDGVLVNSRRVMELSWEAVQERFGIETPFASYFALIGRPFVDIMSGLGLEDLAADIEAVYMATSLVNFESGLQFDGIDEMLLELADAGLQLGIITSKDAVRTGKILRKLPVSFAVVKTPEHVRRGKPAPDALLAAMVDTAVDPSCTVFIGDMAVDQQAASRARIAYGHAAWGYGEPDARHPYDLLEMPSDIVKLVRDDRSS